MAGEVTGKTLKLTVNNVEQTNVRKVDFDRNFTMVDATNTGTTGAGKESIPVRAKTTMNIEAELQTGAGVKITGATLSVTIGGQAFLAQSVDYNQQYDEFDATNTGTASPNMASVAGRFKATSSFTVLMSRATADKVVDAAPASVAVVITFATGATITGNAILHQMSISDEVNGACLITYNAEWQGVPVEVGIGTLTMATEQTFALVFETGSSTNKEITGNLILLSKSISSGVNEDTVLSYSGSVNGAITPAVYS